MPSPRQSPSVSSSVDQNKSSKSTTEDFHHRSQNPHQATGLSNRLPSPLPEHLTVGISDHSNPPPGPAHNPSRPFSSENSSRPLNSDRSFRSTRSSVRSTTPDNVYVNNFRFNQDGSCFAASTTEGFRVFTCSPLSEFARRETSDPLLGASIDTYGDGSINIIAMLYRSHSFAFVTHKEPKKVQLWNDREGKVVGTIRCRHVVRNVLLGREVIAVVTENAVYVYLAGTITPLHVLATGYNHQGLCAISSDTNAPWIVACPTITPGAVRIQTSETVDQGAGSPPCQGGIVFQAHQNPLGCIALNTNGSMVGTASVLGTVIKIFNTHDGGRLYELRLASVPHEIRGISIRGDGQFVAATSNSLKIHIFKLDEKTSSSTGVEHPLDPSAAPRNPSRTSIDSPVSSPVNQPTPISPLSTPSVFPSDWDSQSHQSSQHDHRYPSQSSAVPSTNPSSSSSSTPSGFAASTFGSFTSAFVNQGRGLVSGTLKTVLPKYFAPTRSFAQLALPVDPELDVRSCNHSAIAQHRTSPCENCRMLLRQRGGSTSGINLQQPMGVTNSRPRSSSGAARFVEGLGRSTSSFLSGTTRHYSQDDTLTIQQSICPCGFGTCWGSGPLCTFAGDRSNHFYVMHHDGFFYEGRFDSQYGGQCQILSVSPWFAPRRDFNLQGALASVEAPPSAESPHVARLSFSSSDEGFKGVRPSRLSLSDFNLSDIEKMEHGQAPTEEDREFEEGFSLERREGSPQHSGHVRTERHDSNRHPVRGNMTGEEGLGEVENSRITSGELIMETLVSSDTTGEWEKPQPEERDRRERYEKKTDEGHSDLKWKDSSLQGEKVKDKRQSHARTERNQLENRSSSKGSGGLGVSLEGEGSSAIRGFAFDVGTEELVGLVDGSTFSERMGTEERRMTSKTSVATDLPADFFDPISMTTSKASGPSTPFLPPAVTYEQIDPLPSSQLSTDKPVESSCNTSVKPVENGRSLSEVASEKLALNCHLADEALFDCGSNVDRGSSFPPTCVKSNEEDVPTPARSPLQHQSVESQDQNGHSEHPIEIRSPIVQASSGKKKRSARHQGASVGADQANGSKTDGHSRDGRSKDVTDSPASSKRKLQESATNDDNQPSSPISSKEQDHPSPFMTRCTAVGTDHDGAKSFGYPLPIAVQEKGMHKKKQRQSVTSPNRDKTLFSIESLPVPRDDDDNSSGYDQVGSPLSNGDGQEASMPKSPSSTHNNAKLTKSRKSKKRHR